METKDVIVQLRTARGLSQDALAEQVFVTRQAVGANPISILIPCHRVVGANGKLTGYAGGLDKKRWLLRHEGWLTQVREERK